MKNISIQVAIDEEKLNALTLYLGKKGLLLSSEINEKIESLYSVHVPKPVQEFIEARNISQVMPKTLIKKEPNKPTNH